MDQVRAVALVCILCSAICLSKANPIPKSNQNNLELLILHNNDMHARFEQTSQLSAVCKEVDKRAQKCYGGFARVANRVREARKQAASGKGPPVLYLNAGDTYTGTVWFTVYKWEIAAAFVNMLNPDAMSLGNHEFDKGVSGLSPFIKNVSCPVVVSNLNLEKVPELLEDKNLKKSIVLEVNGTKIGIIGYLTPDTKFLVLPNDVEYEDEIVSIKKEVTKLKAQGVKFFIALGHSGYDKDKEIAEKVADIDLVIGGHTHTFLWSGKEPDSDPSKGPYPTMVKQASGKNVPVVQAYAYTKYLGKLLLTISPEGDLIKYEGEPILLDNKIPQENDVLDLLEKYRGGVDELSTTIVGKTKVLLDGGPCRLHECNIGNLIADSMVFTYALTYNKTDGWSDAPIAIQQGGGIRTSISHNTNGNITKADILDVLPFDNMLIVVQMTGKVLMDVLEWSVYSFDPIELPGAFLQYSGIIVNYDVSKSPGSRVVSALARCGLCEVPTYSKIKNTDLYNVLIPEFLHRGGDGFKMLTEDTTVLKSLGVSDVDAVIDYLSHKTPVYPEIGNRITILGNSAGLTSASSLLSTVCLFVLACFSSQNI